MVRRLFLLAPAAALVAGRARAGSYGSADKVLPGVRISIDASVGYWSDHEAEGRAFERKLQRARQQLAKVEPLVAGMMSHYLRGAHTYAGRRPLIAAQQTTPPEYERTVHLELVLLESDVDAADVKAALITRARLDEPVGHKLAADFVAAQLAPGGALVKAPPRTWNERDVAGLLGHYSHGPAHYHLFQLLKMARQAEPLVRALAARGEASLAAVLADVVVATLDGKPYPAKLWARAAALPPDEHAQAARLAVLLSPDARFAADAAAAEGKPPAGDAGKALREWLRPLTSATKPPP